MDQATAEADPYNWTFYTNTGTGTGSGLYGAGRYGVGLYGVGETTGGGTSYTARRRQEGGMVEQYGDTLDQLLTRITAYEAQRAALSVPVSHEWGHLFGTTSAFRARLIGAGG